MKKKISIGLIIILIVLFLGLFATYLNFKNSPKYTMYQLIIAEKDNNPELTYEYFDFDKIADGFIGRISNDIMQEAEANPFAALGFAMVQNMKPALIEKMKKEVVSGNASEDLKNKSKFEIFYICFTGKFANVEDKYKKVSKNKVELTTCSRKNEDSCTPPKVLEKIDGKWIITDIKINIPEQN